MALSALISKAVRERANYCCEYCLLPTQASVVPFEVDHIIAKKHGGQTDLSNLALSCFYCNSAKGPNIAGIDPDTKNIVPLFHPRSAEWRLNFALVNAEICGLTASGRATVAVLEMNAEDMVLLRTSLIAEGLYPPKLLSSEIL